MSDEPCMNEKSVVERLLDASNGHPYAKIPWPHRLLHDAVAEIEGLRSVVAHVAENCEHEREHETECGDVVTEPFCFYCGEILYGPYAWHDDDCLHITARRLLGLPKEREELEK